MIILCCSRWVINKNIISFLCSCIIINVYKACIIDFQSEISSYDWINFDFDSDIDWISKHSHSFDIKNSSMKVMSVTLISIRAKDLNIFSKLFKMTSTVNDLKLNESSDMLMKQNMSMSLSITTLTRADRFFEFVAISCTWVVSRQSYALCFDFLHLKQSSFLNNSFWIELRFNLLNFFHKETDDVSQAVDVLKTEWAAWITETLMTDQAFNSVNLISTCMQMLINSFKFVIHSLSVTRWRSELILCWRSSSKVLLLYFSSALNLWNFIQNLWKKILFSYSFKYCRWVMWWWLKSLYILLMIDSTSSTSRKRFRNMFLIHDAMCLIAASLTRLSM